MKKLLLLFMGVVLLLGVFTGCPTDSPTATKLFVAKTAWAKAVVSGDTGNIMEFYSNTTDKSGNVYGVGIGSGNENFDLGNSVVIVGDHASNDFPLLVKYNSSGVAQWAKLTSTTPGDARFNDVAVADDGSIYAVGYITGNGTYNFGDSVTVAGTDNLENILIVKYNSSGVAQWAKSVTTGPDVSRFNGVVIDTTGNIYAVGQITGTTAFDFSGTIAATGAYTFGNVLIVKYDSAGEPLWAKTTEASGANSSFDDISIDSSNNLYIAGWIYNTGTFDFGNSKTVAGAGSVANPVIIKYNSSGVAQWATSTTTAPSDFRFSGISTDSTGVSYAVGFITGTSAYSFGTVNVSGSDSGENLVVAKFDASGVGQWAKSATGLSGDSIFNSVAVDSKENVYVGGYITGDATVDFGNSIITGGAYASGENIIVLRYDSDGVAQWVRGVDTAPARTYFNGVTVDSSGNLYGSGYIAMDATAYTLGDNVSITSDTVSFLLVKYE